MSDNEYLDYEGLGYLADHINAKDGKKIKKKLRAGDTSLTINDSEITSNSLIDIYSDVHGLNATSVTQGNGTLSITFPAQANDLNVIVIVRDSRNSRVNMYKADYDANGDVENAGGIAAFVSDQLNEKAYLTDDTTETSLASDDLLPFYDVSATAKKKMSIKNFGQQLISNPNLLDNAWFTVNQRGESSYTSTTTNTYCLDRWLLLYQSSGTVLAEVNENGVNLTVSTDASYINQLYQVLERNLLGQTVTISVIIDDILYSATGTLPNQQTSEWVTAVDAVTNSIGIKLKISPTTNSFPCYAFIYLPKDGITHNIKAAKVEIGNISTLMLDSPPDYGLELLKCQRYFYNTNPSKITYSELGVGFYETNNTFYIDIPIHIPMRATPSVTMSGEFKASIDGTSYSITDYSASVDRTYPSCIKIKVSKVLDAPTNSIGIFSFKNNVGVLQFSAEL